VLLVSSEESLITEQNDAVPEVRVEAADEVLGVTDLEEVTPPERAE